MGKDKDSTVSNRLREHSYDGIKEYDNCLPNWWLWTLYLSILFSFYFYFAEVIATNNPSDGERITEAMQLIEAKRLAATEGLLNDETLWQMSQNKLYVEAGREVYLSMCQVCHGDKLQGGVGLNLADLQWRHVKNPVEIYTVTDQGIPGTGMAAWGQILGPKKTSEVVAFVLSYHSEGLFQTESLEAK